MNEEEKYKAIHKYKLELLDKLPYNTTKNLSAESLANLSIEQLEQLNPNYKPPKEERKLTPQEQDLEDIKAMGNPKFKFDFDDPKFAKLSPAVKTIYKERFEHLVKGLDKELTVELPKTTAGKMSMKTIPTPETIRYNPAVIVPIMSRKEIDTIDQVEKIQELRKVRDQFQEDSYKKDIEIDMLNARNKALQREVAKERYNLE